MAHFCISKMVWLRTDWFPGKTQPKVGMLMRRGQYQAGWDAVNAVFDAHVADRAQAVCVPMNFPDPWPAALTPFWAVTGGLYDEAAMFLGAIYCRVAIAREEQWVSSNYSAINGRPRIYRLWGDVMGASHGIGGGT